MAEKLYPYRFQIFLITLIAILFGILVFPDEVFEEMISPFLFLSNIIAGIFLISKKKKMMYFFIFLMVLATLNLGTNFIQGIDHHMLRSIRMFVYFLFYVVVTLELIHQIWNADSVGLQEIFGVISGYISLGLIGFFICLSIETYMPGSFKGLGLLQEGTDPLSDSIMYYSYITMLTIGYGDIVPANQIAQKSSILLGLMGQFYLVIITAIIVGKFISQSARK